MTIMRTKTSIFKGVSKFRNKWRARIRNNTIGIFEYQCDAAIAYNEVAVRKNQLADKVRCSCCGEEKPIKDFYKDKRKVLGVSSICKTCHGINVRITSKGKRSGVKDKKLLLGNVLVDKINNKKIAQSFANKIWNDKQAALSMA